MVISHEAEGYEEFWNIIKELESQILYVLFVGSVNKNNGKSWCPDCVKAEPLIDEVVNRLPNSAHFLKVFVGNREFWKDKNCPFRTDKKLHLTSIPTLVKWNSPERLEGANFNKKEIIEMAFEEHI